MGWYKLLNIAGLAIAVVWCATSLMALADLMEGYEVARFVLGASCMGLLLVSQLLRAKMEKKEDI